MTVRVEASVDLPVEPATAFASMVDLPSQERWIIATSLYPIDGSVAIPQVGSRMAAFTGIGSVGFLDTMVVTVYDPPWRWITQHEGEFVRGVGIFEVHATPGGSRVTWAEELDLPFGVVGRLGWPLIKPLARIGLQASLRRLAKQVANGTLPLAAVPEAGPV
jgi:carbon monoxide dehydrogenase subunit G